MKGTREQPLAGSGLALDEHRRQTPAGAGPGEHLPGADLHLLEDGTAAQELDHRVVSSRHGRVEEIRRPSSRPSSRHAPSDDSASGRIRTPPTDPRPPEHDRACSAADCRIRAKQPTARPRRRGHLPASGTPPLFAQSPSDLGSQLRRAPSGSWSGCSMSLPGRGGAAATCITGEAGLAMAAIPSPHSRDRGLSLSSRPPCWGQPWPGRPSRRSQSRSAC